MSKIKISMIVPTLVILGASSVLSANQTAPQAQQSQMMQHHSGMGHKNQGQKNQGHKSHSFNQLNLTEDQQNKMAAIDKQYESTLNQNAQQRSMSTEDRAAMQKLLTAPEFNEKFARDLIKKKGDVRENNRVAHLRKQHEMYQILTPEQRTQHATSMSERMERRNNNHSRHQGKH